MAVRQSKFGLALDKGLVFFGIKEGEYNDDLYVSNTPEPPQQFINEAADLRPVQPARPAYTAVPSVHVVGGNPRVSAIGVTRDTPPSGTPTFATTVAETKDVELFIAHKYNDCQEICEKLKARRVVVLNTAQCDSETSRRIQAFVCGYIYAVNGRIQSIVKGQVIIAEPVRGIHTAPEAIERLRRNNFEF
jgi:FtsZ-interacting cell division protein YlmF